MADYFWSRAPGKFVMKDTGKIARGASFTGTVREWYETLVEVMIDVVNEAARDKLPGEKLKFLSWRCDADVGLIVECSVLYKPHPRNDNVGTWGYGTSGVIYNIPLESDPKLHGRARFELVQFEGSEYEKILGSVQILDVHPGISED